MKNAPNPVLSAHLHTGTWLVLTDYAAVRCISYMLHTSLSYIILFEKFYMDVIPFIPASVITGRKIDTCKI